MTENNTQPQFLKLNGEPVDLTLKARVTTLAAFKAAGFTAVFNLASTASLTPETMAYSVAGSALGLIASEKGGELYDWMFNRIYFGKNFRELAIKTAAGTTSPDHQLAAQSTRNAFGLISFITIDKMLIVAATGLSVAFTSSSGSTSDAQNLVALSLGTLGSVSSYLGIHFGNAALCHHKVVKGQYSITDKPKPVKKEETVSIFAPQPGQA